MEYSASVYCYMKGVLIRRTNLSSVNETTAFVAHFMNNFSWSAVLSSVLSCEPWFSPRRKIDKAQVTSHADSLHK